MAEGKTPYYRLREARRLNRCGELAIDQAKPVTDSAKLGKGVDVIRIRVLCGILKMYAQMQYLILITGVCES